MTEVDLFYYVTDANTTVKNPDESVVIKINSVITLINVTVNTFESQFYGVRCLVNV